MALVLADRVKETTTTTGTGAITLLGASVGYQSFSVIGNGNTTYYTIADQTGSNWEVGIGTYTASGTTLSRTTVLSSSNGGALVNFGAGTKDVFVTYPSEFSSTEQIGDIKLASTAPTGPGTWLETGKYYSKSSYPALATSLGSVADFGTMATVPSAQLPQQFATPASGTTPYLTATDGSVTVAVGTSGAIRKTTDGSTWSGVASTATANFTEVRYLNGNFVAVGGSGNTGLMATSSDGTTWIARAIAAIVVSTTAYSLLNSVAYGNGKYVAVGNSGLIQYSSDLSNWSAVANPGTSSNFNRIIYANSLFVAVGSGGACYTSSDGVTWTSRSAGGLTFYDVIYANSLFVAVGIGGACYTSSDGVTWTSRSAGAAQFFNVIYANSLFVAVGVNGTCYTSSDGVTWTSRTTGVSNHIPSVVWNGTNYVAVSLNGRYSTSSDGITWTGNQDASASSFYSVAVINGKTIAFGVNSSVILAGATRAEVLQSGTWAFTIATQNATNPRSIAYNGSDQYVIAGSNGVILTSSDGQSWTGRASGLTTSFDKVYYVNSNYIAMGGNGSPTNLLTSSDGITWTSRTAAGSTVFNAAAYGASVYVAVGAGGTVYSSTDLATWTSQSAGVSPFYDVIFANSVFVAVGVSGACYSSTDGTTWTSRSAGTATFQRIIYGNSLFVAVASGGTIYTSPDGTTWTARTSNVTGQLNDVVWNGSLFCAVGASGNITTSSDGVTWTARTPGDPLALLSISWSGTRFIVTTSGNAAAWTSTDGITWSRVSTAFVGTAVYSCYLGGKFLMVGTGFVQTSTDGVQWTSADQVQCVPTVLSRVYKLGGNYYAATNKGLFQSTDGITFSAVRQTLPAQIVAVAYSGSIWIATYTAGGGHPQAFYKSTNGTTWTKATDFGTFTSSATLSGTNNDLVYANGNFISGQTVTLPQGVYYTIYTSTDGVTWTGRQVPYLTTPGLIASDGTTAVTGTGNGSFKSTDGGVSWTQLTSSTSTPVIYSNGAWVFNSISNYVVSPDLSTFYSTGITASAQIPAGIYVSGNNIVGIFTQNKMYFNKSASGYVALPAIGYPSVAIAATGKEYPVRGTTVLITINQTNNIHPNLIMEVPLYSYDTSTTFWIPPTNAGAGQKAYIYAGA